MQGFAVNAGFGVLRDSRVRAFGLDYGARCFQVSGRRRSVLAARPQGQPKAQDEQQTAQHKDRFDLQDGHDFSPRMRRASARMSTS